AERGRRARRAWIKQRHVVAVALEMQRAGHADDAGADDGNAHGSGTPSPTLPRFAGEVVQRPLSRCAGEGRGGRADHALRTISAPTAVTVSPAQIIGLTSSSVTTSR